MKLRQMQCLCALVDAGFNISRAATRLHATQPAVGKQLRQFEDELGVSLMLRQGGRPVALTEPGERVLSWSRRALQCADNIRAVAKEGSGEGGGSLTLATSHTHANYILLPALLAFGKLYPQVKVNVLQGAPEQVADLVHQGKVALGVAHMPPELPGDVVAAPFLTSARLLVAPVGHPVLKAGKPTLERLAAYPLILQRSSRPEGPRIVRTFQAAGLDVHVAVQVLDADVIKTYVRAGLGIGIIPAFSHSPSRDRGLSVRDVSHLFDDAVSAVLLRRQSYLPGYVYAFLERLAPALERRQLEALVLANS